MLVLFFYSSLFDLLSQRWVSVTTLEPPVEFDFAMQQTFIQLTAVLTALFVWLEPSAAALHIHTPLPPLVACLQFFSFGFPVAVAHRCVEKRTQTKAKQVLPYLKGHFLKIRSSNQFCNKAVITTTSYCSCCWLQRVQTQILERERHSSCGSWKWEWVV